MSSRALLAPPGARRGAAASTKYVYDAQKPSEHRRGRNKPGVLKLLLPKVAGAALLCAAATYQVPRDTPGWHPERGYGLMGTRDSGSGASRQRTTNCS